MTKIRGDFVDNRRVIHSAAVDMWIIMDKLELMRLFEAFEEYAEGDFPPEEWEAFLRERGVQITEDEKEKYFAFYDDIKDKSRRKQDW